LIERGFVDDVALVELEKVKTSIKWQQATQTTFFSFFLALKAFNHNLLAFFSNLQWLFFVMCFNLIRILRVLFGEGGYNLVF